MKKSLLVSALFALAVLVAPAAADASSGVRATIRNTGPKSYNKIRIRGGGNGWRIRINNNTDVKADVHTDQDASSGNAYVKYNTQGGDADTGDADNDNETNATLNVENINDGAGCCENGEVNVVIDTTGPWSDNIVKVGDKNRRKRGGNHINNDTHVDIKNNTNQNAHTGDAKVAGNTEGGSATTGDAENNNSTDVDIQVVNDNSGAAGCGCDGAGGEVHIENTGPGSYNKVYVGGGSGGGVSVDNNTNVHFNNNTNQNASSGDAKVKYNTTGGDATTGDATNTNSTSLNFSVHNSN